MIEARYLFGLPPQRLQALIHPQSVIHSMVRYRDGSVIAQLGAPDMRTPIAYGLSWPERIASGAAPLDFGALGALTFERLDAPENARRFPGVRLAWDALAAPQGTCAVLNAANEVAVAEFLEQRIRFDQIDRVIHETLNQVTPDSPDDLATLLALDGRTRAAAGQIAAGLAR